jgi:hypothetical protein
MLMQRSTNFIAFQLGWLACVLGAAYDMPMLGPGVVAGLLAMQSFTMSDPVRQVGLVTVVAIIGTAIDTGLLRLGVYWLEQSSGSAWLCPLWITALWVNIGMSLHGWLRPLQGRYRATALLGAVAGPTAYLAADVLGAIRLAIHLELALLLFAALWAVLLPILFWIAQLPPYDGPAKKDVVNPTR